METKEAKISNIKEVLEGLFNEIIDIVNEDGIEDARDIVYALFADGSCDYYEEEEEDDDYEDDDYEDGAGVEELSDPSAEALAADIAADIDNHIYSIEEVEGLYGDDIIDRIKYLVD